MLTPLLQAREFHRQTGNEYFAGLWKAYFRRALLWRRSGVDHDVYLHHFIRPKPQGWRAPSWSRASWDGSINPSLVTFSVSVPYDHDISILESQIIPAEKSGMERLKAGCMRVRGLCAIV